MADPALPSLSRRERQIMDVVYRLGRATAQDVLDRLSDPPSYSAVRAHLRVLEEKGHLLHEVDGPRYVYRATVDRTRARRSALEHLVETFFAGSTEAAVAALLDASRAKLDDDGYERLARRIEQARREGR